MRQELPAVPQRRLPREAARRRHFRPFGRAKRFLGTGGKRSIPRRVWLWREFQPDFSAFCFVFLQQERRLFTNFHRQLFCWLDKWVDLTMEDIRRMEDETKRQLDEVSASREPPPPRMGQRASLLARFSPCLAHLPKGWR